MIVEFEPEHLDRLVLQAPQTFVSEHIARPGYGSALAQYESYTALCGDRVVGCIGVVPQWAGRAVAWGLLSDCGPARFLEIHRAVERWLWGMPIRRLETYVACGHEQGERWMAMLGFERECCCRSFLPDARDAWLYARIDDRH